MKVLEKRLEECMNIRFQLKNVGIESQYALELQPLFDIMNSFIREGTSASGSLSIDSDYFSKIDYMFTCNDSRNSYCNIVR
jgi:hypothetical protein